MNYWRYFGASSRRRHNLEMLPQQVGSSSCFHRLVGRWRAWKPMLLSSSILFESEHQPLREVSFSSACPDYIFVDMLSSFVASVLHHCIDSSVREHCCHCGSTPTYCGEVLRPRQDDARARTSASRSRSSRGGSDRGLGGGKSGQAQGLRSIISPCPKPCSLCNRSVTLQALSRMVGNRLCILAMKMRKRWHRAKSTGS